jgi:hypothetical protein
LSSDLIPAPSGVPNWHDSFLFSPLQLRIETDTVSEKLDTLYTFQRKENIQHNIRITNPPLSQTFRGNATPTTSSIPDEIIGFFNLPNSSSRIVALG